MKRVHIIEEIDLAKEVFTSTDVISEGASMESYINEVQLKCNIDLSNLSCVVRNFPFFMEGNRHTIIRQKVLKHIGTNAKLASWEPIIDKSLNEALDNIKSKKQIDLLADFVNPFLQKTTCTLLGILTKDPIKFEKCTNLAEELLNPLLPIRTLKKMDSAFTEFLEEVLSKEPAKEIDGNIPLLTALLKEPIEGFSRKDITALVLVIYAGTIALRHTLANIIFRILTSTKTIKQAAARSEWVHANLDYLIRESVAVKKVSRLSKEPFTLGSLNIKKNDKLIIDLQAVHHGTSGQCPLHKNINLKNENLKDNSHLAFGRGSHFCLGVNYSKIIFEKIIPVLFKEYPNLALQSDLPDLFEHSQMLSVKTLHCHLGDY
ncbi:cytochrome P450 [uncultured Arcticibacterium sp.]|uniref:cytochrome P450 n=1 Tax=uncultured Arcticibacterium sp. TaxID=2173042 RepID=UPI0030F74F5C